MTTAFFDALLDFKKLGVEISHLQKLHLRVSTEGWPDDTQDAWIMLTAMAASIEKAIPAQKEFSRICCRSSTAPFPQAKTGTVN